jgi:hypothetical protein
VATTLADPREARLGTQVTAVAVLTTAVAGATELGVVRPSGLRVRAQQRPLRG